MHIASLSSSSGGGNAYLVWSDRSRPVLIDCGISLKKLTMSLSHLGMSPCDIAGLFITHEHSDHIQSLCLKNPLAQKFGFPAYASRGFWEWYFSHRAGCLRSEYVRVIGAMDTVTLDGIRVTALAKPHDANEPLAFLVESFGERTAVVMDLGHFPDQLARNLKGVENLVFESNHDVEMEKSSGRPYPLIRRVLGDYGHLSNEQAGRALASIVERGTKKIVLAHLSEDCNTPQKAKSAVTSALLRVGLSPLVEIAPARSLRVF